MTDALENVMRSFPDVALVIQTVTNRWVCGKSLADQVDDGEVQYSDDALAASFEDLNYL